MIIQHNLSAMPASGGGLIPTNPTTESEFFKVMGGNVSTTGHMGESIPKAELVAMDNTGHANANDNPFVSVHMDFGPLIDTDHKIEDLIGTGFYANCCTDCCPCEFKFTDGEEIKKVSTSKPYIIEVGLKKNDGSYYGSADELCDALVKSSDVKSIVAPLVA